MNAVNVINAYNSYVENIKSLMTDFVNITHAKYFNINKISLQVEGEHIGIYYNGHYGDEITHHCFMSIPAIIANDDIRLKKYFDENAKRILDSRIIRRKRQANEKLNNNKKL